METKADIRKYSLSKRNALSKEDVSMYGKHITDIVREHNWFKQQEWILPYVSFGSEVPTQELISYALSIGKRVAVPKVYGSHTMEFIEIHSLNELSSGHFGVLEPTDDTIIHPEHALVIMPGVAFDNKNHRIGYGKGYYDTYLRQHPSYQTIALAFSVQCMDNIPTDSGDISPQILITEKDITYDRIMERCSH